MRVLVIGGSGLIGAALVRELRAGNHHVAAPSHAEFDLINPPPVPPGFFDAAVITAGPKGFKPCEGNVESWRINVDGAFLLGRNLMRAGVKLVFVSSDAVEWSSATYARQKALVEIGLLAAGDPAIVRPERVTPETAPDLAKLLVSVIGRGGIYHWPSA